MKRERILVTGASQGIGEAISIELDRRGFDVICVSRSGRAKVGAAKVCDMTDEEAIKRLFREIQNEGPLHGIVNNAGFHSLQSVAETKTADFEAMLRMNVTSVMIASREAYPLLRATGGTVVNMGSLFGKLGVRDNIAYAASKAAVGAMTRCMAAEWGGDGIAVVNVAPGYIETELNRDYLGREKVRAFLGQRIPVRRPGTVEEVARFVSSIFVEKIVFLTGETIYVDGGQGVAH
ncbi:short-chain dehydrogenase [Falsochrobactrum shanghaiense]|uniref:Short-chain dehydrogenase n=1 Tax=Falsochrobactrum shanghaiense TaxID=2201899 RepID=A0A316JBV1_9HYPH|nr:SDR family oxidoreductase [Falsochrobactrum shanghaiense]PWL16483.1 short-chain dehydrogenase [Falsochrobactrum shanghaiense]